MTDWFRSGPEAADDTGRDMMLADALRALDPAAVDPNYWFRFRSWVMTGAGRELARRRLMAELTISDVLTSWARTLVPTAALAAALATIVLMRAGAEPMEMHIGVEEMLVTEISSETAPILLAPETAAGLVAFASDIY